jgi:hypothetical protein
MVRHEKHEGSIHIAWGYDNGCIGYFLAVEDDRLTWEENATKEVNEIAEKVAADGGGSYFDLNTYRIGGFGYNLHETIWH